MIDYEVCGYVGVYFSNQELMAFLDRCEYYLGDEEYDWVIDNVHQINNWTCSEGAILGYSRYLLNANKGECIELSQIQLRHNKVKDAFIKNILTKMGMPTSIIKEYLVSQVG